MVYDHYRSHGKRPENFVETVIEAIDALKEGKAVVFPTDTVYGVGVAVRHSSSPQPVSDAKKREEGKPVAWLVDSVDALDEYGEGVSDAARELAEQYWPGALTIVVKASDAVPEAYRGEDGTIGLRMPDSETASRLMRVVGPLAVSSANMAGAEAPCRFADIDESLLDSVAASVCDDASPSGIASTVVDCSGDGVIVIRQGDIVVEGAIAAALAGTDELADGPEPEEEPEAESKAEDRLPDESEEESEPEPEERAESEEEPEEEREAPEEEPAPEGEGEPEGEPEPETDVGPEDAHEDDPVYTVPLEFISHDLESHINAKIWTVEEFGDLDEPGDQAPKAIIQIVHGMAEHIDRYDDFARYLVGRGFVVCAEDHVGHGGSVECAKDFGHIPVHGGKDVVIGDVHTLHHIMARSFPDVPYVMYGHSMGSFIARAYIARYGDELTACVLSGTGNVAENLSKSGNLLARFIASVRGERHRSKLIDNMGAGAYGKKIPNARTPLDWLSTDESVVDEYIADERCGFMFTVGGYATLLDLTAEVVTSECASAVPEDLPVFLVAGDGDPVGDMGEGVKAAAQLLRDAGVKVVDEKIYAGMRHEIHNEIGNDQVYDDIATWIEEHV